MQIHAEVELPFPADVVFKAYRDRLADCHMPNIKGIKVVKREDKGDVVELVNEWTGGGDMPKAVQAVISEGALRWTDYATWTTSASTCAWRTEVSMFPGAVKSSGLNKFESAGSGMKLIITGELECDASKMGVPKLLAKGLNGTIEKFLVSQIQVNLVEVGKSVGKLLESERK